MEKEPGKGEQSHTKLGSACGGGGRWSARQAVGRRGQIGGLAKERLASRLRLREASGVGTFSELLSVQDDLENTGDLQVRLKE